MEDKCVAVQACAKLNLFLEVTGKRGDGFHNLDSVFVEIDLADRIEAIPYGTNRMFMLCDDPDLPVDDRNLALRAALLLHERTGAFRKGLEMRLHKKIPCGGGLGGGSSDAAAVLRLANDMWGCGLSYGELLPIAAELGSDVPFFLQGGVCRCRGRGGEIEPLPGFSKGIEFGLALPSFPSSTARAYANLALPGPGEVRTADAFIGAMARGNVGALRELAFNRFEESVFRAMPRLGGMHADLEKLLGHSARMSGSGSALWFFAEKGWRDNARLQSWAAANGVTLLSARAAGRGIR